MWRAIWNLIKNLFFSCFPSMQANSPTHEVEPLLTDDHENSDDEIIPSPDNIEQPDNSSSVIISRELNKPVTLTPEESALTIYYAQRGEDNYINSLSIEKQKIAYDLITSFVKYNINQIDRSMKRLVELNINANRLETSWRRVRSDLREGDPSQYNIIPVCNDFITKYVSSNTARGRLQIAVLDKIKKCFDICKKMLSLKMSRQQHTNKQKTYMPPKEELMDIVMRTESQTNAKTLKLLNDFNQRCADYEKENPPRNSRTRRGKLFGYN